MVTSRDFVMFSVYTDSGFSRTLSIILLAALVAMSCPGTAATTTDTGDWVRECEESTSDASGTNGRHNFTDHCFIRQTLLLKDNGQVLFDIAAGYPLSGTYPMLLMSVPLGVYLPAGINFVVDDTERYQAILAYCNTEGCHSYYRMTESLYRMFRSGRWLNVSFVDGTRRTHRFKVSLNGFTSAIESLRSE